MDPASAIASLQATWSAAAQSTGTVTIDAAAITAAGLTPCTGFDELLVAHLMPSPLVVTTSAVPLPSGATISSTGNAPARGPGAPLQPRPRVLPATAVPLPSGTTISFTGNAPVLGSATPLTLSTIVVWADSGGVTHLSLSVAATLANINAVAKGTTRGVFPAFSGDPFDVLVLSEAAVLFTTAHSDTLAWNGTQVTVSRGLQFQAVLDETQGPLGPVATLLNLPATSQQPVLSGTVVPTHARVGTRRATYPA